MSPEDLAARLRDLRAPGEDEAADRAWTLVAAELEPSHPEPIRCPAPSGPSAGGAPCSASRLATGGPALPHPRAARPRFAPRAARRRSRRRLAPAAVALVILPRSPSARSRRRARRSPTGSAAPSSGPGRGHARARPLGCPPAGPCWCRRREASGSSTPTANATRSGAGTPPRGRRPAGSWPPCTAGGSPRSTAAGGFAGRSRGRSPSPSPRGRPTASTSPTAAATASGSSRVTAPATASSPAGSGPRHRRGGPALRPVVTWADQRGRVRAADALTARELWTSRRGPPCGSFAWSADGTRLAAVARRGGAPLRRPRAGCCAACACRRAPSSMPRRSPARARCSRSRCTTRGAASARSSRPPPSGVRGLATAVRRARPDRRPRLLAARRLAAGRLARR